VKILMSLLATL